MNRTLYLILALVMLTAAQPVGAVDVGAFYQFDREGNKTWDRMSGGTLVGGGARIGVGVTDQIRLHLFVDQVNASNDDWDPAPGDFVPDEPIDPPHQGNIQTERTARWLGLRGRWGENFELSDGDRLFQPYLFAGLAQVRARVKMDDEYQHLSVDANRLGWLGGVGIELVENSGGDANDKLWGLFIEAGRREYRLELPDLGSGFGFRLSHAWFLDFGLSFYLFE